MRKETLDELRDPGKAPQAGGRQQGAPRCVWGQWGGAGGEGQENLSGGCTLENCIGVDFELPAAEG